MAQCMSSVPKNWKILGILPATSGCGGQVPEKHTYTAMKDNSLLLKWQK